MNLEVTLQIEGPVRTLPADPSLVLYRGAPEALTNVAAQSVIFSSQLPVSNRTVGSALWLPPYSLTLLGGSE